MKYFFTTALLIVPFVYSYAAKVQVQVASGPNRYEPAEVTINVGDTVEFVWVSGFHPTVSDDNLWEEFTPSSSQKLTPIKFTEAGTFTYFCSVHEGMEGVITVNDVTTGFEDSKIGSKIEIYPNPAISSFTVNNIESLADRVLLKSMSGQTVFSEFLIEGQNVLYHQLTAGNYLLILENRGEIVDRKKLQIAGN